MFFFHKKQKKKVLSRESLFFSCKQFEYSLLIYLLSPFFFKMSILLNANVSKKNDIIVLVFVQVLIYARIFELKNNLIQECSILNII